MKLTPKGKEILPKLIEINDRWEEKIGLSELDDEFFEALKRITYRSIDLNKQIK